MVEQINIFEYLEPAKDPLFCKIRDLRKSSSVRCGSKAEPVHVMKNHIGIYEVQSEEFHESFSTAEKCYEFVSEYLSEIQLRDEVCL